MTKNVNLARQFSFRLLALSLLLLLVDRSTQESTLTSGLAPAPRSTEENDCFLDDRCTLLSFKKRLWNQGDPALGSWNEADVSKWTGVTWTGGSNATMAVEKLELPDMGLLNIGATIYPLLHQGLPLLRVLDISGNRFNGTLPVTLQICGSLQVLDLSNNSFAGHLPLQLSCGSSPPGNLAPSPTGMPPAKGTYPNLETFNLSSNEFRGGLPPSLLVALSSIQHLDLSGNSLTGSLPVDISRLYTLRSLTLDGNKFTGSLPTFSENCTYLKGLMLNNNRFTGSIPFNVLANLPSLEELHVGENLLNGTMDIGGGGFKSLKTLDVKANYLRGSIPPEIGNLSTLESLFLQYNNLTGAIPAALSGCSRLIRSLSLQYNALKGTIPTEISQLSDLSSLSLNHNKLSGPLPSSLAKCSGLRSIWLGQNELSGSIPAELGNLTNLVALSLFGKDLKSSIPPEIGLLTNLVALDVSWNSLEGTLPRTLCNLHLLQVILFNNNQLSGDLLDCLWNYTSLRLLDVSFNMFTGPVPTAVAGVAFTSSPDLPLEPPELSSAIYVEELADQNLVWEFTESPFSVFLTNNNLSGEIPASLGKFTYLQQFLVSSNNLSGTIPASLGNLSSLLMLDLSFNQLSGNIPSEMADLHFLSQLNLSYNALEGPIPDASQFLTFSQSSFLGNPGLCGFVLDTKCAGANSNSSISPPGKQSPDNTLASRLEQAIPILSFPGLMIGFVLGFLGMGATLVFVDRARQYLFMLTKLTQSDRDYNRQYGLFDEALYGHGRGWQTHPIPTSSP